MCCLVPSGGILHGVSVFTARRRRPRLRPSRQGCRCGWRSRSLDRSKFQPLEVRVAPPATRLRPFSQRARSAGGGPVGLWRVLGEVSWHGGRWSHRTAEPSIAWSRCHSAIATTRDQACSGRFPLRRRSLRQRRTGRPSPNLPRARRRERRKRVRIDHRVSCLASVQHESASSTSRPQAQDTFGYLNRRGGG